MSKRPSAIILTIICASIVPATQSSAYPLDDYRNEKWVAAVFTKPTGKWIHAIHQTKSNYRMDRREFSAWCKDKAHGKVSVQKDRPFEGWTKVKCTLEDGVRDFYTVTYNRKGQCAEGDLRFSELPTVALEGIREVFGPGIESTLIKGVYIWKKQYHVFNLDTRTNTWVVIPKKIGQYW